MNGTQQIDPVRLRFGVLAVIFLPLLLVLMSASADFIEFNDGRRIDGTIEEVTDTHITIITRVGSQSRTEKFPRRLIARFYRDESNNEASTPTRPPQVDARVNATPQKDATANVPRIGFIPLKGQVGLKEGQRHDNGFDSNLLYACLDHLKKQDATVIVLEIDSPGGRVDELMEILELIRVARPGVHLVAWANQAFSAAAIMTLACDRIIVHPDARIGAAVPILVTGQGVEPVSAKMSSAFLANCRSYVEQARQQRVPVLEAMINQSSELWWHPVDGFASTAPASNAGWKQLDDQTTVLSFTAGEAELYGLSKGIAGDRAALLKELQFSTHPEVIETDVVLRRVVRGHDDDQKRLDLLEENIAKYARAIEELDRKMKELNSIVPSLERVEQRHEDGEHDIWSGYRDLELKSNRLQTAVTEFIFAQWTRGTRKGEGPVLLMKRSKNILSILKRKGVPVDEHVEARISQMKEDARIFEDIKVIIKYDRWSEWSTVYSDFKDIERQWSGSSSSSRSQGRRSRSS